MKRKTDKYIDSTTRGNVKQSEKLDAKKILTKKIKEIFDEAKDKNIFDLHNTNDLSSKVKRNLRIKNKHSKIISLFDIKPILSIDEILVGLARKFNIENSRTAVIQDVYNLRKANIVKNHSKAGSKRSKIYEIVKD